jgi:hypothetical protein
MVETRKPARSISTGNFQSFEPLHTQNSHNKTHTQTSHNKTHTQEPHTRTARENHTQNSSTLNNKMPNFQDLPAEVTPHTLTYLHHKPNLTQLRVKIYRSLFVVPKLDLPLRINLSAQFLRTSKDIYNEGSLVLYSENTFISTLTSRRQSELDPEVSELEVFWNWNSTPFTLHDTSLLSNDATMLIRHLVILPETKYICGLASNAKQFIPYYTKLENLRTVCLRMKAYAPPFQIAKPAHFPGNLKVEDHSMPEWKDLVRAFLKMKSELEIRIVVQFHHRGSWRTLLMTRIEVCDPLKALD